MLSRELRIQVGTVQEDGRTGKSWNRIYYNPGGSNTQKDRSEQQGIGYSSNVWVHEKKVLNFPNHKLSSILKTR